MDIIVTVPILMYHSISRDAGRRFRPYAVPPETLAAHMAFLHECSYTTLTVRAFARALTANPVHLPARPVVITFDDGFADFYTDALPILESYGFKATLFIPTKFVGRTSAWLEDVNERKRLLLTWPQLTQITACGIEIGAHSHSHCDLDIISPRAARYQIVQSKTILEQRLGSEISSFAYPYGRCTPIVRRIVQDAGYSSACATKHALSTSADDRFALARIMVTPHTDIKHFATLLAGRGLPVTPTRERIRTKGWRLIRHSTAVLKRKLHLEPLEIFTYEANSSSDN